MKILITGGCGFIGSHLVEALIEEKHELVIVDDLSTGRRENIERFDIKFYEVSVSDYKKMEAILQTEKVDAIYHLAAIASVQQCKHDPLYSSEVNSRSTLQLLDMASRLDVKDVFFSSSAAVYGDEPSLPKSEESPIAPISIYGIDKYASEQYLMEYHRLGKLKGTAFRFFNVFGPRQDPSSPYSGVLSIFYDRLIAQDLDTVTIFGDGRQSRDFIFVSDVVQALLIPLRNDHYSGQIYNVATGFSVSLLDVISAFEKNSGRKVKIDYQAARSGDIKFSEADVSKLKSTGFVAEFSFENGLNQYIKYA